MLKAKIENNPEEKLICIATTHILYNPKRGDCKLAQVQLLLAHLDRMAFRCSKLIDNKLIPTYWPTILCGDFNCSNTSKLYEFIVESKLKNYKELNRNDLSGQFHNINSIRQIEFTILPEHIGISDQSQFKIEVEERFKKVSNDKGDDLEIYCSYGSNHLRHKFNFKSAYKHYNENNELEITSIVGDEPKKSVDYIFYHSETKNNDNLDNIVSENVQNETNTVSKKRGNNNEEYVKNELELIATLGLFSINQLDNVYLPNKHFPSDHFLLAAKFELN
jgi:protein angel